MVSSSKKSGLGQTLTRAHKVLAKQRSVRKSARHNVEDTSNTNTQINLRSVTDQTNLSDFLEEAELAGKTFVTEKRNVDLLEDVTEEIVAPKKQITVPDLDLDDISKCLRIPRRPQWNKDTTPEELDANEKKSFLAWRKTIAVLQESNNLTMTPFEKNIEVWRQLWRVIERSELVVQILDCRNPLLYLCNDLIDYVESSGNKENIILLNKADFLTYEQRKFWCKYFKDRDLRAIFFSALLENQHAQNGLNKSEQFKDNTNEKEDYFNQKDRENEVSELLRETLVINQDEVTTNDADIKVFNRFELLDEWRRILEQMHSNKDGCQDKISEEDPDRDQQKTELSYTVGLVGYPNVGKSSTINALLSAKRVAVSATPGKTKHFQTFLVEKDMILCDCPGLVFPNFINSRAEMVINGILPIDQMKDSISPVRLIVDRIPKAYFEEVYGLAFEQDMKQNLSAEDLLNAYGFMRGYMTARGLPDISRAARKICKDYLDGKILYCEHPPGVDKKSYHSHSKLAELMKSIEERAKKHPELALRMTERQRRLMAQAKGTNISSQEFDNTYYIKNQSQAHIKGLPNIGNLTKPVGLSTEVSKPKREKKHKKREKLRRVYRELDI